MSENLQMEQEIKVTENAAKRVADLIANEGDMA